jgi:hypothetical protein
MPTTLLKAEADQLTNPSLQRGVVETIIDKGASDLTAMLPFDSFAGQSYDYNLEDTLPSNDSSEDPYGSDIADGVGKPERIVLDVGMLARDVKTPIINKQGKSDINDQRARDIMSGAKKMAKDFVRHHVRAMGVGTTLNGFEKFLLDFSGDVFADGTRTYNGITAPRVDEQKVFHTSDGTPGVANTGSATKNTLDTKVMRQFLTRSGDEPFDVVWCDEDTYVEVQEILSDMPGNMAQHIMDQNFGRPVLQFNGTRIMKLDAAGDVKVGKNIVFDSTTDPSTLKVENASDGHQKFHGFSDLDIGRNITIYNSNTGGSSWDTGVIDDLDSSSPRRKVEVTMDNKTATTLSKSDSYRVEVEKTNVMYGLRYDDLDGATAFYHQNMGVPADPGEQYQGPIAGFNVTDMDRERSGMRALLSQVDWFGDFAIKDPRAVARLSHYKLS